MSDGRIWLRHLCVIDGSVDAALGRAFQLLILINKGESYWQGLIWWIKKEK